VDDFDEMMKSLGMTAEEDEPAPIPLGEDGDVMDLDSQLEAMLQADQDADDDFEPIEVGPIVSTRSIYDAGGMLDDNDGNALIYSKEESKAAMRGEKKSIFSALTVRKLLVAGFVLLLVFVGAGTAAVLASRAVAEQRLEVAAMAHFTPISLPLEVANNANFVHVNQRLTIGAQDFSLSRIAFGYSGTYVYFNELFDPEDFAIVLYDQKRRLYVRQQFDLRHDPVLGTILRFDPIYPDALFLTLHVQSNETREYGEFNFRLVGGLTFGAPLFYTHPISLMPGSNPQGGLRISQVEFSNIETVIHYSFSGSFAGVGLRQRDASDQTFIHMRDNFTGLKVLTDPQAIALFPCRDAFVGRATFGPLMSLHSQVDIVFRDLYFVYLNPIVDIPLRHLSGRNQDEPHTMYMGAFRLNLEAVAMQQHLLVLVLHGVNEAGQRMPTYVTPSLHVDIGRGETVVIPAQQVNVSPLGTDVVFNLWPDWGLISGVHIDHYTLVLETAEFGVPEVSITLDLSQAVHHPGSRRETAILAVESAFASRLSYMSGEIGLGSVIGFAPELLHDEEVMAPFAPRTVHERPMYGATVVVGDFIDNYTFLAVVESEWAMGSGGDMQFLRTSHQVIARSHDGIWSIVSDERISH